MARFPAVGIGHHMFMPSTEVRRRRVRDLLQDGAVVTTAQLTRYGLWSQINVPAMQSRKVDSLTFVSVSGFDLPEDSNVLKASAALTELRSHVTQIARLRWSAMSRLTPHLHYSVIIDEATGAIVEMVIVDRGERWSSLKRYLSQNELPHLIYLTYRSERAEQVRHWLQQELHSRAGMDWFAVSSVDISTPDSVPFVLSLWESEMAHAPKWLTEHAEPVTSEVALPR